MKAIYSHWRLGVFCTLAALGGWTIGYYSALAGIHYTTAFVFRGIK